MATRLQAVYDHLRGSNLSKVTSKNPDDGEWVERVVGVGAKRANSWEATGGHRSFGVGAGGCRGKAEGTSRRLHTEYTINVILEQAADCEQYHSTLHPSHSPHSRRHLCLQDTAVQVQEGPVQGHLIRRTPPLPLRGDQGEHQHRPSTDWGHVGATARGNGIYMPCISEVQRTLSD